MIIMVAYSFQSRFVPAIQAGHKKQTIRACGRRSHAQPGDLLQLYVGMRTKACRKIAADPICIECVPIFLRRTGGGYRDIVIDGRPLARSKFDSFARLDGFMSAKEMGEFWRATHGHECIEFEGVLIRWGDVDDAERQLVKLMRMPEAQFDEQCRRHADALRQRIVGMQ